MQIKRLITVSFLSIFCTLAQAESQEATPLQEKLNQFFSSIVEGFRFLPHMSQEAVVEVVGKKLVEARGLLAELAEEQLAAEQEGSGKMLVKAVKEFGKNGTDLRHVEIGLEVAGLLGDLIGACKMMVEFAANAKPADPEDIRKAMEICIKKGNSESRCEDVIQKYCAFQQRTQRGAKRLLGEEDDSAPTDPAE